MADGGGGFELRRHAKLVACRFFRGGSWRRHTHGAMAVVAAPWRKLRGFGLFFGLFIWVFFFGLRSLRCFFLTVRCARFLPHTSSSSSHTAALRRLRPHTPLRCAVFLCLGSSSSHTAALRRLPLPWVFVLTLSHTAALRPTLRYFLPLRGCALLPLPRSTPAREFVFEYEERSMAGYHTFWEVRSKISNLEMELVNENEKLTSLTTKIDKLRELQQEREKKFDLQYQRTIAEALDNYLTAVQRDHEHVSQLEERKIRDDMAREEAKRREKAIQEEKMRQDRIRAEEEARLKAEMAERAKAVAIEAEKKAAEEAAAKRASETLKTAHNAGKDSKETLGPSSSTFDVKNGVQYSSVRNIIKASENALALEKRRSQIYEELSAKDNGLKGSANQDYRRHGQTIGRLIKTISATIENIRTRAAELAKLVNSPECPQSISIKLFAEKIISCCTNQRSSKAMFATSRVIVLVTSKIPLAMDILLAELNRVCIYTVPKHISYSGETFRTKDDYFKAIGYKEEKGKIESTDDFIERLNCYMKLYGALVQTEVGGFQNLHGVAEGWAWLARFLNTLPANRLTATALDSFLQMAGYALYCRYKNQFEKLLSIIARDFLNALEGGAQSSNPKLVKVKMSIRNYIETKQYKREPEGLQLSSHLESNDFY